MLACLLACHGMEWHGMQFLLLLLLLPALDYSMYNTVLSLSSV